MALGNYLEDVIKGLEDGRVREVGLDDSFIFECQRSRNCCRNITILLFPYDILRAANHLKISEQKFIDRYCETSVGPDSRLPVVWLKKVASGPCEFLRSYGCGIYSNRPTSCRMWPMGRMTNYQEAGKVKFFLMPIPETCHGLRSGRKTTIREWLERAEVAPFHAANDHFVEFVGWACETLTPQQRETVVQVIAGILYTPTKGLDEYLRKRGITPKDDVEVIKHRCEVLKPILTVVKQALVDEEAEAPSTKHK